MFATLSDRLADTFRNLRGKGRLSEADIDATAREIRIALLEADVALPVVKEFVAAVKERARGEEVSQALNPAQQVVKIVNEELVTILGGETRRLRFAKSGPTVIMLAGLQGAGKTTLAAKLGLWLKGQDKSPLLVAADLQRPNAVQQLQVNGERAGVPVFAPEPGNAQGVEHGGDPVAVARASIEEAKRKLYDVVIVDTAGRLGVDAELMQQAADIRDAVQPDEVLFVVDAMIGQDAVSTAQAFLDGVGFDGVVLTKLDGDARGGAALSIASVTGRPVMFASAGEKLTDFDLFHPDRMASRILDMGDMLTLIEQAEKAFDQEEAAKAAEKLMGGGDFTLDDFLAQMQQVRKLGSMSKIMGMLPGMGQFRDQLDNFDEREIDRIQAIIQSMTPAERANPKIIDGSRRARIAKGSGRQVSDVNNLVDRFFEARKMMQQFAKGGMPGVPGMPGMAGGGKRGKQKAQVKKAKGRRVSGNPAKAAQQAAAEKEKAAAAGSNPFGNPNGEEIDYEKAAAALDLPKDFSKFLK
ncbi:MAG TPA: signal recognition particle protein [Nocardioides bacterium]|uniref:signal recognition particle protein n=1 Tax=uncultured Nocardioides sp. TaxID=198441 RepID=UPI000EC006CF|nr:signal recognition particle protein [uncultured Nocardioides sp.]HCB06304.1 signal recognition particle protein [Nocardioides sp.]HRD63463.1 signal recognition particle protein [Nocardioides sp.]HRK47337.1 signal recognition particle protein [Nocardioides sp.]